MALALLYRDLAAYRSALATEVATQAGMMAQLAEPALAFGDRQAGQRNLSALRQNPRVIAAALYHFDGSLFASYGREQAAVPPRAPAVSDDARLADKRMELVREIRRDGELLGSIYLGASYDRRAHLRGYLGIVTTMLLLSMGVALLLAV